MPDAARVLDMTQHGPPMQPGIGSLDVTIGYMPAWRALPAKVGAAVTKASEAVKALMDEPVLTPASAGSKLGKITKTLGQSAGKAAGKGNSSAVAASASAVPAMMATNVALTAAWTAASPVPGGQPAANQAYTLGIKAAAAAASSAVFAAIGSMADTHICPIPVPVPPHGPGMVCKGSETVFINNLPASRKDDKIMEAAGGADPISKACTTVIIGDEKAKKKGGKSKKGKKGKSGTKAGKAGDGSASQQGGSGGAGSAFAATLAAGVIVAKNRAAAQSGRALCEVCEEPIVAPEDESGSSSGAGSLGAEAFTTEDDVTFGQQPQGSGDSLLAHEAAHVVQQSPPVAPPTE